VLRWTFIRRPSTTRGASGVGRNGMLEHGARRLLEAAPAAASRRRVAVEAHRPRGTSAGSASFAGRLTSTSRRRRTLESASRPSRHTRHIREKSQCQHGGRSTEDRARAGRLRTHKRLVAGQARRPSQIHCLPSGRFTGRQEDDGPLQLIDGQRTVPGKSAPTCTAALPHFKAPASSRRSRIIPGRRRSGEQIYVKKQGQRQPARDRVTANLETNATRQHDERQRLSRINALNEDPRCTASSCSCRCRRHWTSARHRGHLAATDVDGCHLPEPAALMVASQASGRKRTVAMKMLESIG